MNSTDVNRTKMLNPSLNYEADHGDMLNMMTKNNDYTFNSADKYDQYYYSHGKVLLTGEYFILDGAHGLALPTCVGQSMGVRYEQSYSPSLQWKSFDVQGNLWLEVNFEFWHFNIMNENPTPEMIELQKILRQARIQNKHFLRDSQSVIVETRLGFPRTWGLGSSSTLLYNTAQWAYTSPFELAKETFGGSGYDIACAGSDGPIIYHLDDETPNWSTVGFDPSFKDQLFFIYSGSKQNTRESIQNYRNNESVDSKAIEEINQITAQLLNCCDIEHFNELIDKHEKLVGEAIGLAPIKEKFPDFAGSLKSLGAWGGDFMLASSAQMSKEEISTYFAGHGLDTVISFNEFVLPAPTKKAGHAISDILQ